MHSRGQLVQDIKGSRQWRSFLKRWQSAKSSMNCTRLWWSGKTPVMQWQPNYFTAWKVNNSFKEIHLARIFSTRHSVELYYGWVQTRCTVRPTRGTVTSRRSRAKSPFGFGTANQYIRSIHAVPVDPKPTWNPITCNPVIFSWHYQVCVCVCEPRTSFNALLPRRLQWRDSLINRSVDKFYNVPD